MQSRDIDLSTGAISTTVNWSARSLLDSTTQADCDNRKIYAKNPDSNALIDFSWSTKSCASGTVSSGLPTALQGYFTNATLFANADPTVGWAQYSTMSADQKTAAAGANLVNFIRGQRGKEGFIANDATKLYRARSHILGDIVSSQPMYVKQPNLSYQDPWLRGFQDRERFAYTDGVRRRKTTACFTRSMHRARPMPITALPVRKHGPMCRRR